MMTDRILVIGTGASEGSLCWKLAQSVHVKQVLCAPGNEGVPDSGKVCKSAVLTSNPAIVKQFCKDHNINLVMINAISLLTTGLIDDLSESGVRCFGPKTKAAQLEANKSIAKDFLDRHGIPTAKWKSFTNPHEACSYITYADFPALVVKASALTLDKDLYITRDKDEACRAVQQLTQDWTLGASEAKIIVEERLEGEEYYCPCITDGITLVPMPFLHIQKHSADEQKVPQLLCSGMAQISDTISKIIHNGILQKAGDALKQEGWNYTGFFAVKIMVTETGPVVLGVKCSLQDMESQTILPLLKSDLYEVIQASIAGRLCSQLPEWSMDGSAVNASLKQREMETENQDEGGSCPDAKMLRGESSSNGNTSRSSSEAVIKPTTLVAFSGAAYRKHGTSPAVSHQRRTRNCDHTHEVQDAALQAGYAGVHPSSSSHVTYFDLNSAQYKDPLYACTTNSIGEKIKVAQLCNLHKLAAQGLVITCISDLVCQGAQTTYFMPYCACGHLPVDVIEAVADGLALGCRVTGSTLLEREITRLPGTCPDGSYSLFGCALSIMERRHRLPRLDQMREGDVLIGVHSSGVHSSSLGLLENILESHRLQYTSILPLSNGATTWGEMIMDPDMIYRPSLLRVLQSHHIRACVPITGGGLVGSILSFLPESFAVMIDALCWRIPGIYSWLFKEGDLSEEELVCNFNCGVGAVLVVQRTAAQEVLAEIQHEGEAWLMGVLIQHASGSSRIQIKHLLEALKLNNFQLLKTVIEHKAPARTSNAAVFISPTGTKLKVLIETVKQLGHCVRLALIISDKTAVEELRRAAGAGIPTRVVDHTMFSCHSEFEYTVCTVLEEFSIHLICLAGFGRILSKQFLNRWKGKILKLYSTLFPSSKVEPSEGAMVCGCTVCFMLDGSYPGPIILQETIAVDSHVDIPVCEQMEEAGQRAVAKALHLVASGTLSLGVDGYISWNKG